MRKPKFTDEKMLAILAEADREGIAPVAQRNGISRQAIYVWRKRFGLQGDARGVYLKKLPAQLGEPLTTDLKDFCALHYGAPEINVIREAIRNFIDEQLARDPELKKKFEKRQQDRMINRTQNSQKEPGSE